jgi:hypothetical protein
LGVLTQGSPNNQLADSMLQFDVIPSHLRMRKTQPLSRNNNIAQQNIINGKARNRSDFKKQQR